MVNQPVDVDIVYTLKHCFAMDLIWKYNTSKVKRRFMKLIGLHSRFEINELFLFK